MTNDTPPSIAELTDANLAEVHTPLPDFLCLNPALEERDDEYNTLLAQALLRHDNARAMELIRAGANVNVRVHTDEWAPPPSALTFAAACGKSEIVRLMLQHDGDIFGRTTDSNRLYVPPFDKTPVAYAAENGQWAIVELLLANGAELPAALAGAACGVQAALMRALLKRGAQPKNIDELFWTVINKFCRDCILKPISEVTCRPYGDVILMLLEQGANPNSLNVEGECALHTLTSYDCWCRDSAAKRDIRKMSTEMARLLFEHGANVNIATPMGRTPLSNAVWWDAEDIGIVCLMLQHGAHISTSLFRAVKEKGLEDIVHLFKQYGATE